MIRLFCIYFLLLSPLQINFGQGNEYIEPTGTYVLNDSIDRDAGPIYDYFGDIQVLSLKGNRIVMTFFICRGAPSYNIGTFVDTLNYVDNRVIFRTDLDSTCIIKFDFDKYGITVEQSESENFSTCGFGHAVVAHGYFKKVSGKKPKLINPVTGEKLKRR